MSRLIFNKYISVFKRITILCVVFSIVLSCSSTNEKAFQGKENKKYRKENVDSIFEKLNEKIDNNVDEGNILNSSPLEVERGLNQEVVDVKNSPEEVVSELLEKPFKTLNVAIVIPLTGKYASVGDMVVNSAILNVTTSKYENNLKINIYDIGKLSNNWRENEEVKRLLLDGNDIVIGSIFEDTTQKLLSVLPKEVQFISFINNNNLLNKYKNLSIMSADDTYKFLSLFEYLNNYKRTFLSVLLPSTKKGYNLDKIIKKLAKDNNITVINSHFYQVGDKLSMTFAVSRLNQLFDATFFIDENGELFTENIKQKNKQINKNETTKVETKRVNTNSIFIDANENDLSTILSLLDTMGILERDVQIFSSAIVDFDKITFKDAELVNFIGYNYNFISHFNTSFKKDFAVSPNYLAYMTYDTLSMLNYLSNKTALTPEEWFDESGFRGILDEFRFSRNGNVERKMGLYHKKSGGFMCIYNPNYYYNILGEKISVDSF